MSTTDRAAEIRKTLKAKYGWTSRDVSVVSDLYSMGSSIRVKIKNPAVPKSAVAAIADTHESVRRCAYSGEILSGGNRFVFVEYADEALAVFRATWLPAVEAAAAKLSGSGLVPIEGTPYLLRSRDHRGYSLWGESFIGNWYDASGVAARIGTLMVEADAASGKAVAS